LKHTLNGPQSEQSLHALWGWKRETMTIKTLTGRIVFDKKIESEDYISISCVELLVEENGNFKAYHCDFETSSTQILVDENGEPMNIAEFTLSELELVGFTDSDFVDGKLDKIVSLTDFYVYVGETPTSANYPLYLEHLKITTDFKMESGEIEMREFNERFCENVEVTPHNPTLKFGVFDKQLVNQTANLYNSYFDALQDFGEYAYDRYVDEARELEEKFGEEAEYVSYKEALDAFGYEIISCEV
jgi:hypothetical protein